MADPPVFSVRGDSIYDDGTLVVSHSSQAALKAHAEHLRREHANGRVAQSRCQHGPCDRDRIPDMHVYAQRGDRPVVLCAEHERELRAAR